MNSKTLQSDGEPERSAPDCWQLFRGSPDAHMLLDTTTPDFCIVDINKAHERLLGVSRPAVINRSMFEVIHEAKEACRQACVSELRQNIDEVVKTREEKWFTVFRYDQPRYDGTMEIRYWQPGCQPILDAQRKRVHFILTTIRDVTAEMHATRLKSQLQMALDIGKIGSWVWDLETGMVTGDINLARLFNITEYQVTHGMAVKQFMLLVRQEDRPRVRAAIERSRLIHEPLDQEFQLSLQNGEGRWVVIRGALADYAYKKVFHGVVADMTERKNLQTQVAFARRQDELNHQAAKMLQRRNKELLEINRSKDEFVALASHQLRTPATAVKQYVGMVLQGYAGDITDDQADLLVKAFESNERQIQIVNQILNAARVDTGRLVMAPVRLDMRMLVQQVWDDMHAAFEQHKHRYTLHMPARPVWVEVDQTHFRVAIENVLRNACVYTHDGGTITVDLYASKGECRLSVTDTGVGIREADFSKLFAKFSRIHNPLSIQAGGTGIGLYLVSEIVRLHKGAVSVQSTLHHGTTFAISVPLMHNKKQGEHGVG